jgi:ribosomal protein S18 acetylase RimI-like enzyme
MERLVLDAYAHWGPHFECAVGDIDWRMYRATTVQPEDNIRLWEDEWGNLIGFAWLVTNRDVDLIVHPRSSCATIGPEMLAWAEARFGSTGGIVHGDTMVAWALQSNVQLTDVLKASGYKPNGETFLHLSRSLAAELPAPILPSGYSLGTVSGHEQADARARLHLAAFPHSHISGEVYSRLMMSRHYRADLDVVALTPEGELASMALAWFDAGNKLGELEPVGTHPAHRNKGLASAVILKSLWRLQELGALSAIVYVAASNTTSLRLYRQMGFVVIDTNRGYQCGLMGSWS